MSRTRGSTFGAADIDRYDSEIAYTDAAVGRLVSAVRARRPGTIVIVAADHGEEFEEHGGRYHGSSLVRRAAARAAHHLDSGRGAARRRGAGRAVRRHADGAGAARHLRAGADAGDGPRPLARHAARAGRPTAARVRRAGGQADGVARRREADLRHAPRPLRLPTTSAADPHERRNLAEERPARVAYLRGLLDNWLDAHLAFEPGAGARKRGVRRARSEGDRARAARRSRRRARARGPARRRRPARRAARGGGAARRPAAAVRDGRGAGARGERSRRDARRLGRGRGPAPRRRLAACAVSRRWRPSRGPTRRCACGRRWRWQPRATAAGSPSLAEALDRRDDILLCRLIIVTLGKLGDRRAVPDPAPAPVRGAEPARDGGGVGDARRSRRPSIL